jgi:hypothetical protein
VDPAASLVPPATQAAPTTASQAVPVLVAETVRKTVTEFAKSYFSDARAAAWAKISTFVVYLGFLGLGFWAKAVVPTEPASRAIIEFALESPGNFSIGAGLAALCFVAGGNLFARIHANQTRKNLWKLASNPATPEDTRKALIQSLQ